MKKSSQKINTLGIRLNSTMDGSQRSISKVKTLIVINYHNSMQSRNVISSGKFWSEWLLAYLLIDTQKFVPNIIVISTSVSFFIILLYCCCVLWVKYLVKVK